MQAANLEDVESKGGFRAAEAWLEALREEGRSRATIETYAREIRRVRWYCETFGAPDLLAWSATEAVRYVEFLRTRAHLYVCPAGLRPSAAGWTPFRSGLLDPTSVDATIRILMTMYGHFASVGYALIGVNPFAGLGNTTPRRRSRPVRQPALSIEDVQPALERLAEEPKTTVSEHQMAWRDRFILTILSRTSLSAGDLAKARMSHVIANQDPRSSDGWVLAMEGRNAEPLDLEVVEAFRSYREAFRLRPQPSRDEGLGLILSPYTRAKEADVRSGSAVSRRLRLQWKSVSSRQAVWAIAQDALRRSLT